VSWMWRWQCGTCPLPGRCWRLGRTAWLCWTGMRGCCHWRCVVVVRRRRLCWCWCAVSCCQGVPSHQQQEHSSAASTHLASLNQSSYQHRRQVDEFPSWRHHVESAIALRKRTLAASLERQLADAHASGPEIRCAPFALGAVLDLVSCAGF